MAAPIYLFTGPEIGNRNEQVETIKNSLTKKFGDLDSYLLYASDSKIEDIIAKLQTESLFVPATCVVLREAELLKKKEEIELIASWLKTAKDTATLILVSDEISVDAKLTKLVPNEHKQIFWAIDESNVLVELAEQQQVLGFDFEIGLVKERVPHLLDNFRQVDHLHARR